MDVDPYGADGHKHQSTGAGLSDFGRRADATLHDRRGRQRDGESHQPVCGRANDDHRQDTGRG